MPTARMRFSWSRYWLLQTLITLNLYEQFWIDRLGAWHGDGGLNLRSKATAVRGYTYSREPKADDVLLVGPFRAKGNEVYDGNDDRIAFDCVPGFAEKVAVVLNWCVKPPPS